MTGAAGVKADDRVNGLGEAARLSYIPEMDGLRAIACCLVIFFHSAPTGPFTGGFLGVDIFFVLSGYLITSILAAEWERTGAIKVGPFYLQRALRLVPALALFLCAYVLIAPLVWPGLPHATDSLLALFYISDYTYPFTKNPFFIRHTWSLAVEEQFYLIWPLVLLPLLRYRNPLTVLILAWISLTLWRLSFAGGDWIDYYFRFDTHCTGLLAGSILAIAQRKDLLNISNSLGAGALAAFVVLAASADITASALTITVAEVLSFIIISYILTNGKSSAAAWLSFRPMIGIGKLSYGLYLWHFPISYYFRQESGFFLAASATFGLSLCGALASYYTVEKWGRAMKARAKRRSEAAKAAVATKPAIESS